MQAMQNLTALENNEKPVIDLLDRHFASAIDLQLRLRSAPLALLHLDDREVINRGCRVHRSRYSRNLRLRTGDNKRQSAKRTCSACRTPASAIICTMFSVKQQHEALHLCKVVCRYQIKTTAD